MNEANEALEASPQPAKRRFNAGMILNLTGITFLVLGVVFALMYSWQFLGAWLRLLIGFAVSIPLIFFGEKLSTRQTNQWYGQGLLAGGWSLTYFLVYGMQSIADLRVFDNPLLACLLLLTVASMCMGHAIKKRSEIIACLSTILAFVSISMSHISTLSLIASVLLVGGSACVTARQRWSSALLTSIVSSYVSYALFTQPQIHSAYLGFAFVVLFWLVHNIGIYIIGEPDGKESPTSTAVVINAISVLWLGLQQFWDHAYIFLFFIGAAYLVATPFFARRGSMLPLLNSLIGFGMVTIAFALKLNPIDTTAAWAFETILLLWLGYRYKKREYVWLAATLNCFVFMGAYGTLYFWHNTTFVHIGWLTVPWTACVGMMGGITMAICCYLARRYGSTDAHWTYYVAALLLLFLAPNKFNSGLAVAVAWGIEGLVLLAAGVRSSSKTYEYTGLTIFGALALRALLVDFANAPTPQRIFSFIVTGAAFLAGSYALAWMRRNTKEALSGVDS